MKPTAEQIKAIALIVDGEAWKAIEDGRDALPGSLWGFRRDIAMEKAMAIAALPFLPIAGEGKVADPEILDGLRAIRDHAKGGSVRIGHRNWLEVAKLAEELITRVSSSGNGSAFSRIVAARKAHVDAVASYNARLEMVNDERARGNWSVNVDPEYRAMSDAQSSFYRVAQEVADSALISSPGKDGGQEVEEVAIDDDTIVRLMRDTLPAKVVDELTFERHPPLFPQATYDVPTYGMECFVKAILAARPQPASTALVEKLEVDADIAKIREALSYDEIACYPDFVGAVSNALDELEKLRPTDRALVERLRRALEQITGVKAEVSNERFRFFALATADAALAAAREVSAQ